jgi:hypothetical protein
MIGDVVTNLGTQCQSIAIGELEVDAAVDSTLPCFDGCGIEAGKTAGDIW